MDEQGLIEHLVAEQLARVVILYGSAVRGELGPESSLSDIERAVVAIVGDRC